MKDKITKNFEHFGLQYIILKIIYTKPSYGYELIKKIEEFTNGELKPKTGTIYITLKRMSKDRLVVYNNESKKIYTITKKGEKYLKFWLEKVVERKKIVDKIIKFYKLNFKNK